MGQEGSAGVIPSRRHIRGISENREAFCYKTVTGVDANGGNPEEKVAAQLHTERIMVADGKRTCPGE